ncbi:MAG: hypothetical protein ACI4O7_02045 [Aristaeellaceae bacterium]
MSQSMNRPTAEEARRELARMRRRRKRRRALLWTLAGLAALVTALALTVAQPMRLSSACDDPALPEGALVLVNRLAKPSRSGEVAIRWDPASSADTFHGIAERVTQEQPSGALGTVWLELWPAVTLVR